MASLSLYEYVINFKSTCGNVPVVDIVPSEDLQMVVWDFLSDGNIPITQKIASLSVLRVGLITYYEGRHEFHLPSTKEVLRKKNLRVVESTLKRGYFDYYQYNTDGDIETVRVHKSGRIVINPFRDKKRPFRVTSEGEMLYPRE